MDGWIGLRANSFGGSCDSLAFRAPILSMSVFEGYAAVGTSDGTVTVCTLSPLRSILSFDAHDDAATAVNLVTGSLLLTGSADGSVCQCTHARAHALPLAQRSRRRDLFHACARAPR